MIPLLLGEAARRRRSSIAVVDESGALTYGELMTLATATAAMLRANGVRPGERVGICLPRTSKVPIAMLGVWMAGASYVPLDPTYASERIRVIANDAGLELVLGDDPSIDRAGLADLRVLRIDALTPDSAPISTPSCSCGAAYTLYTSGSTGRPKGVVITHRNLISLLSAALPLFSFGQKDKWSVFHSYNFDFSVWELWAPLLTGGTAFMVPEDVTYSASALADFLRRHAITVLNHVPSVFRYLTHALSSEAESLPALRYLILGGDRVDLRYVRVFRELFAVSPVTVNMYGITEATVHATFKKLGSVDSAADANIGSPIGQPLDGHVAIEVRNEEGACVRKGEPGELWLSGAGIAKGYLGQAALTAERFPLVATPAGPIRFFRSGDVGRERENGEFEFLGRADDQIKIHGFRIEPAEVENVIRTFPGISDAAVLLDTTTAGDSSLIAVVAGMENRVTTSELRKYLVQKLPHYMVPSHYRYTSELPMTPSGKLDRRAVTRLVVSEPRSHTPFL